MRIAPATPPTTPPIMAFFLLELPVIKNRASPISVIKRFDTSNYKAGKLEKDLTIS
jgi:hypothetical protein